MARPKGAPRSTTKHDTHLPSLTAKIDKLVNYEDNNLKAFASVTIGGAFTIHGLKVMDSQNGLFVSMPSTKYEKNGKTQYSENFHAITKGARDELSRIVLEAYEQSAYMDRYSSLPFKDPTVSVRQKSPSTQFLYVSCYGVVFSEESGAFAL